MSRNFQYLAVVAMVAFSTTVNAEPIVDQHIKAVGGADKIAKIKTMERSGKVSLTGPFGEFEGTLNEAYDVAGSKGHRVMDLVIFRLESGWTSEEGWQEGPQDGLRDMTEQELGLAKMNGAASIIARIKQEFGIEAFKETGDKKFNDKDCVQLTVAENPLEFYINKETKLLEGISVPDLLEMTFEDYQAIDGVQFAQKVTTDVSARDITVVNEYESTELNGEIDETKFTKPKPVDDSEPTTETEPAGTE